MYEKERGVREGDIFNNVIYDGGEEINANTRIDEKGFEKEKIVEEREMGARIAAKVFVFGDVVEEKDAIAITDETWLMSRRGKKWKKKESRKKRRRWDSSKGWSWSRRRLR